MLSLRITLPKLSKQKFKAECLRLILQEKVTLLRKGVLANLASSNASAAAGGLSPFQSGSSNHYLDMASLSGAMRDSNVLLNNAEITRKMGTYQADQYFSAARTSRRMGTLNAITKGAQRFNGIRFNLGR